MDAARVVGGCIPPSTRVSAGQCLRLLQHQHRPARPGGREGLRPVARVLHRPEHPETGGPDPHGFPGGSRDPVAACPRLLQNAGRQDRRRDGLESVMGLGVGQHDLDARRHAPRDGAPRHGQADLPMGKLISPAMQREQHQFLPAPPEGDGALYGLALENQHGWIGHNGNIYSYMIYPYYLPSERMTMVVMLNSGADIPGAWLMI